MKPTIKSANVNETKAILEQNSDAVMIDVREHAEAETASPTLGKLYPMSLINPVTFATDCGVRKDQPIFLFCRSGGRSMRVAMALAAEGFNDLTNVEGGILAWEAAGLPLKK